MHKGKFLLDICLDKKHDYEDFMDNGTLCYKPADI